MREKMLTQIYVFLITIVFIGEAIGEITSGALNTESVHGRNERLLQDEEMPLFLFAGQSNMIGHTTAGKSADRTLFSNILSIVSDKNRTRTRQFRDLSRAINASQKSDDFVSNFEAKQILKLVDKGLMEGIESPMENAFCFFLEPSREINPAAFQPGANKVSPFAGCGNGYGHELMFSRSLSEMSPWKSQDFTVAKVAQSKTELYRDWMPPHGTYWPYLNSTIHNTPGEWKAFVWHQGQQDVLGKNASKTSSEYAVNLKFFVAAVRAEIQSASPNSPRELPVIILEIGYWPGGGGNLRRGNAASRKKENTAGDRKQFKNIIRTAQNKFVENDGNAAIVKTKDLGRFQHYDAASFLIAGDRIAMALAPLLDRN